MTSMSLRSPEQQKAAEDTAKFSRENVGRSKALGPPDTKLFASGLSALDSVTQEPSAVVYHEGRVGREGESSTGAS